MYTKSLHGENMSTFDNQSMSICCVGKLMHLFGFLPHYLSKFKFRNEPIRMTCLQMGSPSYI